jgi:hypothetical protein
VEFCLCVSLERLAKLVLSIPEGVVERRTAVHPVCAFTSIRRDCVGCSSVRGRVIVSVVRRVDSLAVHCLFTRSRSDKLSSSRILREDRATTTCLTLSLGVSISPPPSERKNEGCNYKTRKNLIDPCGERARGLPRTMGTGTTCKEHATYPLKTLQTVAVKG